MDYDADVRRLASIAASLVLTSLGSGMHEVKLVAADADPGDQLGLGVDLDGDIAVVGAYADDVFGADSGSAYVYVRSGTVWTEQAKLVPSDGALEDNFGLRVAVSGETALIGAPHDDDAGLDTGSAYAFVRGGTTWSEQQKLTAPDATAGDQFGRWVSLDGDTALLCAYLDDNGGQTDAGSAYVFVRSGTTWSAQQKLFPPVPQTSAWFSRSVALDGDTAVIGASREDTVNGANTGAVYVFVRSGTTWTRQASLLAPDGGVGDQFGESTFVDGDTLIVGAHKDDVNGVFNAGSAYVFVRSGTTWSFQSKLTAPTQGDTDLYGRSVSVCGDDAVVGSIFRDSGALTDPGAAFLYHRTGTSWNLVHEYVASDAGSGDFLGYTVRVDGCTYLFGSYLNDHAGGADAGCAYVFELDPSPYCTAGLSASGCQASLSASGRASASATSGFVLGASGVEGSKDGLFYFGSNGRQANAWGSGSSYQCVVPPLVRTGLLPAVGTSGACDGSFTLDLNALWCPGCPKPGKNPGAGALAAAQLWYRDPASTSNQTTSLSDAIEFAVCPR
jgi:hypothetical protein